MALDKQISLFKLDTNAFLTKTEKAEFVKHKNRINQIQENDNIPDEEKTSLISADKSRYKEWLLSSAAEHVKTNEVRDLDPAYLVYTSPVTGEVNINLNNVIAMFESTLSRSFGIHTDELTYDIFVVEIYYYDIAQDIILKGFNYDGKHYVYFSSSAGQIRTKKAVFVEEEKYKEVAPRIMCGLTIDKINSLGGMNINKYLAYVALANSATDLWEDVFDRKFDIDRCIVVDDFETLVSCKVDNIDYQTYEITPDVVMDIPIPHTDGCGMIDSTYCDRNFMIRLPFMKGLLGSFDFKRFIAETGGNPVVKDIWGKEYHIFQDNIQIIFTKSQLKMHKYYSSWDEYKENFKKYNCEAGICNMEELRIPNAKINYQMLQTLYKATDEDVEKMCANPNAKIENLCNTIDNALEMFGVYKYKSVDEYDDYFQKALKIYPELLNDPACRETLRDLKNSLVNRYRSGKLDVMGKFTFVLPDLYAFCQWLFLGQENPIGLLDNNEVYCRLYKNQKELDCLRSPHLYIEHAVRKSAYGKIHNGVQLNDWFCTDAIYTSTHDPISRILQFDVDGDRLLVLAQKHIVDLAKKCMEGVNPLYYEMKKANAEMITSENIYKGLVLAFTGGRIGGISNDITKIWNCGQEITEEEKKAVRWLCMETNFTIDYAKTLFKPTRPAEVDAIIKSYTKAKTPYFFRYAKGKRYVGKNDKSNQVEESNSSLMNKIVDEIKDTRLMFKNFRRLVKVNYLLFLEDKQDVYYNEEVNKLFDMWNRKYGNITRFDDEHTDRNNINEIKRQVLSDLHEIEPDDKKIINSLVVMFYKNKSTRKKNLLWYIYGEQLFKNLSANVDTRGYCGCCGRRTRVLTNNWCNICTTKENGKPVTCVDCGKLIFVHKNDGTTCRCPECALEHRRMRDRVRKYNSSRLDVSDTP